MFYTLGFVGLMLYLGLACSYSFRVVIVVYCPFIRYVITFGFAVNGELDLA